MASDHIFGNVDLDVEDDDIHENTLDNENVGEASNCPFRKLGLDSNLVRAITNPEGYFKLSQPTIVQSSAIKALLPSGIGSVKGKGDKDNLFIQSETGSGKTLAYLLPILQVSL